MALYKKEDSTTFVMGITLVIELLKTKPEVVERIYFHPDFKDGNAKDLIIQLAKNKHLEIVEATKIFRQASDKENCYVLAEIKKYQMELVENANHLVLVNPSDGGNLGTIMRSALGFGSTNIAIIKPAVDCFNPKVIRASMGAFFHLNIVYYDDFNDYLSQNLSHDYFPFMLKATDTLPNIRKYFSKPFYSLIFGNEATGLSDDFLKVGTPIIIEHAKTIDSLNLPIALSIALYEVTKNK